MCVGLVLSSTLLSPAAAAAEPAPGTHRNGYLNPGSAALAPIRLEPLRQGLRELGYVEGRNLVLDGRWGEGNLRALEVRQADEFDEALAGLARAQGKGLIVFADPLTFTHRQRIVQAAGQRGLATVSGAREFVDAGGMISYGPSFPEMFRQAAVYVDKLLHGARAVDLPVEQPTRFELLVGMKTAKALG
jgi:hypothetical protein